MRFNPAPKQRPIRLPRQVPRKEVSSGIGDEGIVANWLFYCLKGGTHLHDFSPYGNHGTIHGAKWASTKKGWALNFGGDDYVEVLDSASLSALPDITVIYWVKSNVSTTNRKRVSTKNDQWYLGMDSHKVSFQTYREGSWRGSCPAPGATTEIDDGRWHLIAGVYDKSAGDILVYVDGDLESTESVGTYSANDSSVDVIIGRHPDLNEEFWDGLIDEGKVYRRVLTEKEILQFY